MATGAAADERDRRGHGLMLVALAAVIWSTGGLIVRLIDTADTWTIVFWRALFATLFLAAYVVWREGKQAPGLFAAMGRPGLVVAGCFALASTCLVVALSLTTVAHTLVIMSTAPFLAALLARPVLGERVRGRTWAAMAAALCGIAVMASDRGGNASLVGDLVAGLIAIALAIATVTIRRHREVRMTPATCLGAATAALVALPLASPLVVDGHDMALLVVFGAFQFGAGLAIFVTGARLAPAAEVSLVAVLEPILGPLWVWALIGEDPGARALAGGAIVLAALVLHTLLDARRRAPPIV